MFNADDLVEVNVHSINRDLDDDQTPKWELAVVVGGSNVLLVTVEYIDGVTDQGELVMSGKKWTFKAEDVRISIHGRIDIAMRKRNARSARR